MIVLGFLMSIAGAIGAVCGIVMYNDANSAYYGIARYVDSTDIDTARLVITISAIVFVIGIIFIIVGYIANSGRSGKTNGKSGTGDLLDTRRCLKCGSVISRNIRFCPNCGNDLDKQ